MKKIISILLLLGFSTAVFCQNSNYRGFYRARFINILESVSFIEAEFEVAENNTVNGKIKIDGEEKILQGTIDQKGKFEIRSQSVDNLTIIIKGDLSAKNAEKKISLIRRIKEKSSGYRSVSESSVSGFVSPAASPTATENAKNINPQLIDNGKTFLRFEHSNALFGQEWADVPFSATVTNAEKRAIRLEAKLKTNNSQRRFTLRLVFNQSDQKVWEADKISFVSYAESKDESDGKTSESNLFIGTSGIAGGRIEIVGETENEIIVKITNLKIRRSGYDNYLQINGFIHAPMQKSQ